jgi:sarcosine oxidase
MKSKFDAIVLGLGAMGSATVYQLAKRGSKVLGIDQFAPPHDYGSTHGESRIIRQAIGEGEEYTPLVLRSYELWRDIERETDKELLTITGGLVLERPASAASLHGQRDFLAQTISSAKKFSIRHEVLETLDIKIRFPQFAVTDEHGYFEYGAGYLRPEVCVAAQLHLAEKYGANIHINEKVLSITPHGSSHVTVNTDRAVYEGQKLVIAAGSWITNFLAPTYRGLFKVYRQVMYWFRVRANSRGDFVPGKFPVFIWIFEKARNFGFYGFPSLDEGTIKVASEQYTFATIPDDVNREVTAEEKGSMYTDYLRGRLPGVSEICESAATCLYTTTADANFVIDFYPGQSQIIVASPCSGHGFKYSAAIGEVIAQLIIDGKSKIDIGRFQINRLTHETMS